MPLQLCVFHACENCWNLYEYQILVNGDKRWIHPVQILVNGDKRWIKFAVGFYDALGADRSYEDAYEFGCSAIDLESIPESSTPVLKSRNNPQGAISANEAIPDTEIKTVVSLENPEGQVALNSAFYVERSPIEVDCYEAILQPGANGTKLIAKP
ncbi:MAG: AAA-like domain-containing protein [Nostoc sp.]